MNLFPQNQNSEHFSGFINLHIASFQDKTKKIYISYKLMVLQFCLFKYFWYKFSGVNFSLFWVSEQSPKQSPILHSRSIWGWHDQLLVQISILYDHGKVCQFLVWWLFHGSCKNANCLLFYLLEMYSIAYYSKKDIPVKDSYLGILFIFM